MTLDRYRQFEWIILYYANLGEMPEWSNGPVSKSGVCHRTEGSNPSLSFETNKEPLVGSLFVSVEWNKDENPRRGFDKTRESEANTAGFEIAAPGRNP